MHHVAHKGQARPELAAGVQRLEIERGEAVAFEQRDRKRVAERKLNKRRGRRRKTERARLGRLRQQQ